MYYRRCEHCESKALATATRCPRCAAAFELNDERGHRHRLVPCPSCKVVAPAALTTCRWCGTERRGRRMGPVGGSIAATVFVSAAVWLVMSRTSVVPIVQASMSSFANEIGEAVERRAAAPAPSTAAASPSAARDRSDSATSLPSPRSVDASPIVAIDTGGTLVAADSIATWEEAKATTWVNVRADRRRDASVLAVLSPDDVVRLGARAAGWRQVSVGGATGWVDPRHFEIERQ